MMEKETKLINYLPEFLRDIREYQALAAAEDHEIDTIWEKIEKAYKDQAVDTAEEYGVGRMEKIFNITPKSMDIADRKFEIMVRLGKQLPYTVRILEGILTDLCEPGRPEDQEGLKGYTLDVFPEKYTLKVLIGLRYKNKISTIQTMIRRICPANMLCLIDLQYNTYGDLKRYKLSYAQLSKLTHNQIKGDFLDDHFPEMIKSEG